MDPRDRERGEGREVTDGDARLREHRYHPVPDDSGRKKGEVGNGDGWDGHAGDGTWEGGAEPPERGSLATLGLRDDG